VLLSVDATDGGTMFFAPVKPDIAQRSRDKALGERDGYRASVRSPIWDRFWVHMAYAAPRHVGGQGAKPSTGTRLRRELTPSPNR
jgi:hypothetical protein